MASSDKELEEELLKAGNRLSEQLPTSVDDLLNLLDQVESYLSRVEQSPSKSMQTALSPSLKALVASELMKHSDDDVKVAVASCISEITRITAPDAPYDDDQMKDVFQLIVSSFEKLSDKSSRSYDKRTSILETVAKVRSCVVMLDLECDALIIEMLHHFLKAIRDYHPDNVFSSMETIMTLVLEESEDISLELLSPILATVKKANEEVMPIARRLGERVLENCATKIRPSLIQSVKSLDISLDDYSSVLANICQETSGVVGKDDLNASGEHLVNEGKLASGASSNEAAQVAKEIAAEAHGEVDPAADGSSKPVMSNGVAQIQDDKALVDSNSSKNPEHSDDIKQSKSDDVPSKAEQDSLGAENIVELEVKPEQTTKRRGKKRNSSMNATEPSIVIPAEPPVVTGTEPSDSSPDIGEDEPEKLPISEKSQSKEVCSSSREDPSVEAVVPLDSKVETDIQLSSPKTLESDSANVASPSPSGSLLDETHPRKAGRSQKKGSLNQEATVSADTVSKKPAEGTTDSEVKAHKRSGKKAPAGIPNEDMVPARADTSKEDSGTASDPEVKSPKEVGKKVGTSDDNEKESSKKQKKEKSLGKGKTSLEKDTAKSSVKDVDKETASLSRSATKSAKGEDHPEGTPRTNSKRKRTPGKEIVSNSEELGENLVGKKIKVWWPKDHKFYEGTVDSWDPLKKKHRVLYTDGDEETLYLKKQKWEMVKGEPVSDTEQGTARPSADTSSERHKKKKGKMNSDSSNKEGKMDASPKRGGGVSSNKSKGAATKSGRKSKDDIKEDGKFEVGNSGKSKDHTPKGGSKSMDDVSKMAGGKSKIVEPDTPKNSKKLEHDTPKTVTKVKGKSPKSGSKPSANGTGKVKSGLSKVKDSEDMKEKSPNLSKPPLNAKRKTPDSSKAQESESKSGKKRRRR